MVDATISSFKTALRNFSLLLAILLLAIDGNTNAQSQDSTMLLSWKKHQSINKNGMSVLGGWATANIIGSAVLMQNSNGSTYRFYQMNMYWNFVNLALAVPGYIQAKRILSRQQKNLITISSDEMKRDQRKTERLFLINSGLDVLYMGAGILMMNKSRNATNNKDVLSGYGKSIVLQGGFLFSFDLAMYAIHRRNRIEF